MSRQDRRSRLTTGAATGFTKPPMWGLRWTLWRAISVLVVSVGWITATAGRLHPVWVGLPVLALALLAFSTIYHVTVSRWVARWWLWWRHRRRAAAADWPAATVAQVAGCAVGVVDENQTLTTMIELRPDPLAPSVVTDTEERTVNTVSIADLAQLMQVLDVELDSIDLVSDGFRAAGGFSDLYQQMTGPTPAAAERTNWIALKMKLRDNLAAIDRRGGDVAAAHRLAAVTCLRAADTLAGKGIDARAATAEQVDMVNAALHTDPPGADCWSHMEGQQGYTGVYYADPAHISTDSPQWWTWALAREVSTLIRLSGSGVDNVDIAALVRYRTAAPPGAPPVSRLGPLYGVQPAMWRQFRIGYLPFEAPIPSTALAGADPVIPFGPTGPLLGSIGDPRNKTVAHLPLAGPITVLCQTPLLLRQMTLRASVTGRPLVVVTNRVESWQPIAAAVQTATVVDTIPEDLPDNALLVLDVDDEWPAEMPNVTVLTNDDACDADIELVDADAEFAFTLHTRAGLTARVRAVPTHEERRLLGVSPPPTPKSSVGRSAPELTRPPTRKPTPPAPATSPVPGAQRPSPPVPSQRQSAAATGSQHRDAAPLRPARPSAPPAPRVAPQPPPQTMRSPHPTPPPDNDGGGRHRCEDPGAQRRYPQLPPDHHP